jgi:hypothetical protein
MNSKILERFQIAMVMEPADLNGGATTGDYFDMSKCSRCLVLVGFGDGTASKDLDIALYQSDDSSGTTTAVLNALETGRIYTKYAGTFTLYQAVSAWTKVTQGTADEKHEPDDNGESVGLMGYEVRREDLTDGYSYIRADLTDPGAAKVAFAIYIGELMEPNAPELTSNCVGV